MSRNLASALPSRARLPGLDLLRASAILFVIVWHFPLSVLPFRWRPATWSGVDLFFVLSGYLIGTQLLRPYARQARPSYLDFLLRRAIRIMPVYFVVVALYFLVPGWREVPGLAPLWRFLTFTLNFGLDASQTGSFSQGWSLCVEEHFYLVLPIVVYVLMRRPSATRTVLVAATIVAAGLLFRSWLWLHYIKPIAADDPHLPYRFLQYIYYPTYNRLDGLVIGVLIATVRLFRPQWWQRAERHGNVFLAVGLVVLVLALVICQSMFSFSTAVFGYPLLALGFGLLVFASLSPKCALSRIRVPGATTIALLSFSLYLTHKEVMHLDNRYLLPLLHGVTAGPRLAIYALTFLAVAAFLYLLIERTGFALRDRWLSPSFRAEPVKVTATAV